MNTPWNALPPGTVLKGRYQVEEFLDQQPAAMVYRGIDLILGRMVALREFVPRWMICTREGTALSLVIPIAFSTCLDAFLDDARQAAREEPDPALAQVLDVFRENQTAYAVEDWIPAKALGALIQERGPMEPEAIWTLMEEGARALHKLHASGKSHGDLRPETMGYTQSGNLRIWSRTGNNVPWPVWREELDLSLPFLTPEVWHLSGVPLMRQDVYGLCACAWYCLTGQPPAAAGRTGVFHPKGQRQRQLVHALKRGLAPQGPGTAAELLDILHDTPPRNPVRTRLTQGSVWRWLTRGRGPKAIAPIHCITAFLALSLMLTGSVLWQRTAVPEREPNWQPPDLLEGLTREQRTLMSQGSFSDGDLSYHFPVSGIPTVTVTGYVGTGTEVTVPEEVQGFSVRGIEDRAFLGSGLKIIRLPDSLSYDPIYFPAGCTVLGGKSTENRLYEGKTELERQLQKALGAE